MGRGTESRGTSSPHDVSVPSQQTDVVSFHQGPFTNRNLHAAIGSPVRHVASPSRRVTLRKYQRTLIQQRFDLLRRALVVAIWAGAFILVWAEIPQLSQFMAGLFAALILLSIPVASRETLLIAGIVCVGTAALISYAEASIAAIEVGLERSLIFAALIPTLALTRATARRMPSVIRSQQRIAALSPESGDIGIVFGSQAFGAVLNTGAFAIMSAVLPSDASPERRKSAGAAALRGMNIAIFWSPFFVGFAVASAALPSVAPWQIMPVGLVLVTCCIGIGLLMFAKPLTIAGIKAAAACLMPILPRMAIAAGMVIAASLILGLTTLGAVVVVMPLLCYWQMRRRPENTEDVQAETWAGLSRVGPDLVLIAAAMVLGTVAESSEPVQAMLSSVFGPETPGPVAVGALIVVMVVPAIVGIHPIVTGTVMIATLAALPLSVSDLVLFEAMLVGWAIGSMVSISSLSVVTSGAMFGTRALALAFGPNLLYAAAVVVFAITYLSGVDAAISALSAL